MSKAQQQVSGIGEPEYTILELQVADAYSLGRELEARGISVAALEDDRLALKSQQYGQAAELIENAGYGAAVVESEMTQAEVISWFSEEFERTGFAGLLEPRSASD